ncbi:MAG: hypothetical protein ABI650_07945 [Dokdonella sp.]
MLICMALANAHFFHAPCLVDRNTEPIDTARVDIERFSGPSRRRRDRRKAKVEH